MNYKILHDVEISEISYSIALLSLLSRRILAFISLELLSAIILDSVLILISSNICIYNRLE